MAWKGYGPEHNTWEPESNVWVASLCRALDNLADGVALIPAAVHVHPVVCTDLANALPS